MTKKRATHSQESNLSSTELLDNSCAAQQTRLLNALIKRGSLGHSTIEAREELDIMHPGGRIKELRRKGHEIMTVWTTTTNAQGHKHRCGRYVLIELSKGVAP